MYIDIVCQDETHQDEPLTAPLDSLWQTLLLRFDWQPHVPDANCGNPCLSSVVPVPRSF